MKGSERCLVKKHGAKRIGRSRQREQPTAAEEQANVDLLRVQPTASLEADG